jgi:hypothetical protein
MSDTKTGNNMPIRSLNEIRCFTSEGLERYTDAIVAVGNDEATLDLPAAIAANPEFSTPIITGIRLDIMPFTDKYQIGRSFIDQLGTHHIQTLLHADNNNAWAWLDAQMREVLYPTKKGKVFVGDVLRHAILSQGSRSSLPTHRHLLRAAVNTVFKYKEDAEFMMDSPTEHTAFEEQIMSRKERHAISGSVEFVKAAKFLYCDPATGKRRRNCAKGKVGSLVRMIEVVAQLDVNYDAASFVAAEFIEKLPRHEFGKYLPA